MGANPEKLRHALAEGVGIAWFALGSLPLLEIGAQGGADVALLDFQHGLWTKQDAHLAAGLVQLPILVRVADTSIGRIGEALDSGACGILAPQIDTADQARRVVNAAHYPPRGVRSGGGVRPLSRGFDYNYEHFRHPVIGMMIEIGRGRCQCAGDCRGRGRRFSLRRDRRPCALARLFSANRPPPGGGGAHGAGGMPACRHIMRYFYANRRSRSPETHRRVPSGRHCR